LVFIVVCLRAMAAVQIDRHFLSSADGTSISYAAVLLLIMGVSVTFVNTQLLMQRFVRDHFIEFGLFVNIGVPRGIVAVVVGFEQFGVAVIGCCAGIALGCTALAALSLSAEFIAPTARDIWVALALAIATPCFAVIPVAVVLLLRLLRKRGGIARVR
jgi:ABC-type antimicrobial peptide transport system permease subunit